MKIVSLCPFTLAKRYDRDAHLVRAGARLAMLTTEGVFWLKMRTVLTSASVRPDRSGIIVASGGAALPSRPPADASSCFGAWNI